MAISVNRKEGGHSCVRFSTCISTPHIGHSILQLDIKQPFAKRCPKGMQSKSSRVFMLDAQNPPLTKHLCQLSRLPVDWQLVCQQLLALVRHVTS